MNREPSVWEGAAAFVCVALWVLICAQKERISAWLRLALGRLGDDVLIMLWICLLPLSLVFAIGGIGRPGIGNRIVSATVLLVVFWWLLKFWWSFTHCAR